jgi:biotin carboxyl carrier protein
MDLQQIKQILDLVREHDLSEFEIEHEGLRLKIRKDANGSHLVTHAAPVIPAAPPPAAAPARRRPGAPRPPSGEAEIELAVVKSPIVGTFYRSSEPARRFVEIGASEKATSVHHRSDEADERDRLRI